LDLFQDNYDKFKHEMSIVGLYKLLLFPNEGSASNSLLNLQKKIN